MAENNMAGFGRLMRYAANLAEYERGIAEGIIDENVFVIVLAEKVAKFKGQTFDWSVSAITEDGKSYIHADGFNSFNDEYFYLPNSAPANDPQHTFAMLSDLEGLGGEDSTLIRPLYAPNESVGETLTDEQREYNAETYRMLADGLAPMVVYEGCVGAVVGISMGADDGFAHIFVKIDTGPYLAGGTVLLRKDGSVELREEHFAYKLAVLTEPEAAQLFFENYEVFTELKGVIKGMDDSGVIYSEVDLVGYKGELPYVEYNLHDKRFRVEFNADYTIKEAVEITPAGGSITEETDPVFSASPAASITNEKMTAWDNKVDKVSGKQLSTEDFTSALKAKLEGLNNYDDTTLSNAISGLETRLNTLVSGDASTAIESFNEIIAFLDGVKDTEDLSGIIASIEQQIAAKQDKITDLDTIRSGAAKGATALQSVPSEYVTESELTAKGYATTSQVNAKQDKITDLQTIREGAAKGATALQNVKTINGESLVGEGDITIKVDVDTSTLATKEELNDLAEEIVINEEVHAAALTDLNTRLNALSENVTGKAATKDELQETVEYFTTTIEENEEVHAAAINDLNDRLNAIAEGGEGGSTLTEADIAAMGFTKNTGTYSKPSTGIPKTDLASAVQTSLGKADTALQSYTEQYKGTVTKVKINGSEKSPDSNGLVDLGMIEGGGSGGGEDIRYFTEFTVREFITACENEGSIRSSGLYDAIMNNKIICIPFTNETSATGGIIAASKYTYSDATGMHNFSCTLEYGQITYEAGVDSAQTDGNVIFGFLPKSNSHRVIFCDYLDYIEDNVTYVVNNKVNELMVAFNGAAGSTIRFQTGDNPVLEFIDTPLWPNGVVPEIEPNTYYELSLATTYNSTLLAVLTPFKPEE